MSMLFDLRRVPSPLASELLEDPSDILFFLHGIECPAAPVGLIRKIFRNRPESSPKRTWQEPPEETVLSLDQAWHILHYYFAKSPWQGKMPQASLMLGTDIGEIDVGYGPARLLNTAQTKDFLGYLQSLQMSEFGANITATELDENEIYGVTPKSWDAELPQRMWAYVEELKNFLAVAVEAEESVILYIY